jgi:hypothetical protein
MKRRIPDTEFTEEKKKERMKAALLGARLARHVPMKAKKAAKTAKKDHRGNALRRRDENFDRVRRLRISNS